MLVDSLNQKLFVNNAKEFNVMKAGVWFSLLKDEFMPVSWSFPSKKGTKVKFKMAELHEVSNSIESLDSFCKKKNIDELVR